MFSGTFCRDTEVKPLLKGLEVGYLQVLIKPEDGYGKSCSYLAPLNQILRAVGGGGFQGWACVHLQISDQQEESLVQTNSNRGAAGLDWISGKISSWKELSGIGTGLPGQWWSPHPWRN